ncbi:MAG: alanine--tRNA ligase, partial [Pseudomonadota bacterium]
YDIDLFRNLILASKKEAKTEDTKHNVSHRVIADHLRSSCFLIADGIMPSNEGRGYVLRRIMRRAMRHAHQIGCKDPLMYRLVPYLVEQMGEHYPELGRAEASIKETLKQEEERFKQTLERGLKLLEEETEKLSKGETLKGEAAFKLYDTYGFPLDLTQDILRGKGMQVDESGFAICMEKQKSDARAAWSGSGDKATNNIWFELKDKIGSTEFLGYNQDVAAAKLLAIIIDGAETDKAISEQEAILIFNQTPFYGESGGQVGDIGFVKINEKLVAEVTDTLKPLDNFHIHKVIVKETLSVGDMVTLAIDTGNRSRLRANHSATHILHAVMRKSLGEHITQRGSLVTAEKLRFDVSSNKAISKEEIINIEQEVNKIIWQNSAVTTRIMTQEEAIKHGAMALFGEKYGDEVRVISMGIDAENTSYSVELCGGTHVRATGDIGLFKIISESAVAAGIRRIEAVTRDGAFDYLASQDKIIKEIAGELKLNSAELPEKINSLLQERKKLEKELGEAKKSLVLAGSATQEKPEAEEIGNVKFFSRVFDNLDPKELRSIADEYRKIADIIFVATKNEGKASLVIAVNESLVTKISAVDLIKLSVEIVGGKGGGGRAEMAQGGGNMADKIGDAIVTVKENLMSILK